ncbi:efflux RND transporter periplasmic adaptor subunit [Paenibacillus humicola]|uniref:efflux RND transporter periplasmic adaptor subunit n=1 Tax=Paenibacillus humicola TaxID=3110540 RepID=UPI00237B8D49|nr:efflux RND transporter periplasmic adaptor subunit [Paenibacillus humicola]
MKKWWVLGIGVLIVAAAVVVYFRYYPKETQAAAGPAVQTTQVRKGTIAVTVDGTGSISPADTETVKSGGQGTIDTVNVKVGDNVKKGAVLATIEGEDNSSQIKSAQLDLEKQQLQLQNTEDQLKGETDEQQIANIKLNIQQTQLDMEQTQEQIADLEDKAKNQTIVSPIDGTVTTVSAAPGDMLGNQASDLFTIADYKHLEIVVSVDELDIAKVKTGQEAAISVEAQSDKAYTGKVVQIADEGTSSNGVASFDVTIAIDNPDGLKSGMSAEATIQVDKKDNILMLPIDAVQSFGGRYVVFLPQGTSATGGQSAQGATGEGGANGRGEGAQANGQGGGANGQNGQSGGTNGQNGQGGANGQGGGRVGGGQGGSRQGGAGGAGRARGANRFGGTPQPIQVGIHNDDFIEVVSGLTEGERVILPTVTVPTTNTNQQQNARLGGGGFGGLGGGFGGGGAVRAFGGGGGGFGGGGGRGGGGARAAGGGGGRG